MASIWVWPAPHSGPEPPAARSLAEACLLGRLEPKLEMRWRPEILDALAEMESPAGPSSHNPAVNGEDQN